MKLKRIVALLLCGLLLVAVTGCGKTDKLGTSSDDAVEPSATDGLETPPALNTDGAYGAFGPKTAMMSVNGKDIYWDEMFYFMNYYIKDIISSGGQLSDWTAEYSDGVTYADYIVTSATNATIQNKAIQYGAEQLGITLTDEELSTIDTQWAAKAEEAGGVEQLITKLASEYCTKELYYDLMKTSLLAEACYSALYGEQGEKLPDADIAEYTADDGYLMAKHILMLTVKNDEQGNEVTLTDEEKAEIHAKMEDLLKQLDSYEGDDFDGYFDELMNANSEDTGGLASYPSGYLFQSGEMVPEFENACLALKEGEYSPIVETTYGYHIVYRIPINYDVVPFAYQDSGYSLRYITSVDMFYATLDGWLNSLEVTNNEDYNKLDLATIFAAG
jgi:hypothetical protein